ncbi:MAG: hypothetical protein KIT10_04365 [Flavobacteriales bacterium]|nr:hypothetical protein [Flavobacteriales bacterium]
MKALALLMSAAALILAVMLHMGDRHEAPATGQPMEVAVHMGRLQRYHQKWWAAGRAGNAELAAFYLHEMEEAMEEIAEADVVDEGVEVSKHMRTYGLPMVAELERLLKEQGVAEMTAQGDMLVNACNSCHAITGHPYLRIQVPESVHFPDQIFTP